MSENPTNQPTIASLDHLLGHFQNVPEGLQQALIEREDNMRDVLFLAGQQFGLYPAIVAEVLAQVGLGSPHTDVERQMIRDTFNNLMEQFARAQRGEGPMPTP
jgi:hypothetical protein